MTTTKEIRDKVLNFPHEQLPLNVVAKVIGALCDHIDHLEREIAQLKSPSPPQDKARKMRGWGE